MSDPTTILLRAADLCEKGWTQGAFERLATENIALRCLLGAGCDANSDGPHSTIVKHSAGYFFCADCGETTRNGKSKPWMNEERLERTITRIAAALAEKSS